jgi:hypothetical protein
MFWSLFDHLHAEYTKNEQLRKLLWGTNCCEGRHFQQSWLYMQQDAESKNKNHNIR